MIKNILLSLSVAMVISTSAQTTLATSLTACYALNGSANDPVNNLNGVLSSVTPTINRLNAINSAYYFSGTPSGYIELPNSALLKANAVSASCWVYFDDVSLSQFIVFTKNGCSSNQEGYQFALHGFSSGSRFEIATSDANCTGQDVVNSTTTVQSTTWYHVGFYAGQDSLKLYVNGVLESSKSNPGPIAYDPTAKVYIGGGGPTAALNLPLGGSIDNLRFYNRKLTNTEMMQLYTLDPACIIETNSIAENGPDDNLQVYPNPGSGRFIINSSTEGEAMVYTLIGKEVMISNVVPGKNNEVDLSEMANGIYFLVMKNNLGVKTVKIVKE